MATYPQQAEVYNYGGGRINASSYDARGYSYNPNQPVVEKQNLYRESQVNQVYQPTNIIAPTYSYYQSKEYSLPQPSNTLLFSQQANNRASISPPLITTNLNQIPAGITTTNNPIVNSNFTNNITRSVNPNVNLSFNGVNSNVTPSANIGSGVVINANPGSISNTPALEINNPNATLGAARYDTYGTSSPYKYNLFSSIDQPWNRCIDGQSCGSCPSNECVARDTFRNHWN